MIIDYQTSLDILNEEFNNPKNPSSHWVDLVQKLSWECDKGANGTFIAVLGTALLARATNPITDPFALKKSYESTGAYSARNLCMKVLAAHSPRLGIDLGVTGREPLNNQPFFAESHIHKELPVHRRAKKGFNILLEALNQISKFTNTTEAREAFRAFLVVRRKKIKHLKKNNLIFEDDLTIETLGNLLSEFVTYNSEFGKRAQATAGGILDLCFDFDVNISKIYDPDRNFAGDIILFKNKKPIYSFEVRDKPVTESDIYHFLNKVYEMGCSNAGVIGISKMQKPLNLLDINNFAFEKKVKLRIYSSWQEFLNEVTFWFPTESLTSSSLYQNILNRSNELEVSVEGLNLLETLFKKS